MKTIVEYVISAVAQGILPLHRLDSMKYPEELSYAVKGLSQILLNKVYQDCPLYSPRIALLYNAYTEAKAIPLFEHFVNLQFDSVYSDSGGLQLVTAGKTVTPEIKQEIYKVQTYSDYAMCFDQIPLEMWKNTDQQGNVIRSRNERSNISNRRFPEELHQEAGILTGKNIKEQIEAFKKLNAKTKVILIVQGNTPEDMKLYFNEIERQLHGDDYNFVGGLAVADTCIGNGELESIEMLRAARDISSYCHPSISSHLHILGVGSIKRLKPIIYLKRSGYLDKYDHISYDSSSHTSCFTYGLLKLDGTCSALGKGRTFRAEQHFSNAYEMFKQVLSQYATKKEFLDIMFGDGRDNEWSDSKIKKRALVENKDHYVVSHLVKACHTYFQIHNFIVNVNKMFMETNDPLLTVRTDSDMMNYLGQIMKTKRKFSKRIARKEDVPSLESFFT